MHALIKLTMNSTSLRVFRNHIIVFNTIHIELFNTKGLTGSECYLRLEVNYKLCAITVILNYFNKISVRMPGS